MSIDGLISDQEFKSRNDDFNERLRELLTNTERVDEEQARSVAVVDNLTAIKEAIEQVMSGDEGDNSELLACILDKIVVYNTGDKRQIKLDVHLKFGDIIPFDRNRDMLSLRDTCY